MSYLQEYGTLLIFLALVVATPILLLGLSYAASFVKIRPQNSSEVKRDAYESGLPPLSERPRRFNFRYYYFALLFVVLDVETVLLFPVAANYGFISSQFGIGALIAVLVFLTIVTAPFLYAWRRRALEWE